MLNGYRVSECAALVVLSTLVCCALISCNSGRTPDSTPANTVDIDESVTLEAFYTRKQTGQDWESYCRSGEVADVVVRLPAVGGELVFWRGNSYLPYWKTNQGQWNLDEWVRRSGDGVAPRPDRVNTYSNVAIIEDTPQRVVIRWRYLATFGAGNPHVAVHATNFVEEMFVVRPSGEMERTVRRGTEKVDAWNDPANRELQTLRLAPDGVREMNRRAGFVSAQTAKVPGSNIQREAVVRPALCFRFDEGASDQTTEEISRTSVPIAGHKSLWKRGVSGTALQFDGYHSSIALPAASAPEVSGEGLTLEGWFAIGAYPWNWAPIIQQGDDDGYFLGIESHGYPGFKVKVNGEWHQLTVTGKPPYDDANHLALFRWYHVAGTYHAERGLMCLYVNGREIARKHIAKGPVQTAKADVRVGKAGVLRIPTEGTHDNLASDFGFDGLIDEVRVYQAALDAGQIEQSFARFQPDQKVTTAPDMQRRSLPTYDTGGFFGARYTRLKYYETWENQWRFGEYPDVVVGFDRLPTKFIFWRGVSYIPMLVNESNQWLTQEFNETGFTPTAPGDCEPMSDKGCRDSHVRVIENTAARTVVHWRYRLINSEYHWANYDEHGWGEIADWYYYIYPDGVASKIMRCYTSKPDTWHEWNEQIAILGEGQHPESVLRRAPIMTLVDAEGRATTYDWNPTPPKPDFKGKIIQMIHVTGKYQPFAIQRFERGTIYRGETTPYSVFPSWNHWPTAQINSSGRNASFPDRAAHSSISQLVWPLSNEQRGKVTFQEKILLEGMTDQPATSLMALANSWLSPPSIEKVSGGVSYGYHAGRRAYAFKYEAAPLRFQIAASAASPIQNACFEIRNWQSRETAAAVKVNGMMQPKGPDVRQGIHLDRDGTPTLIVWLGLSTQTATSIEIERKQVENKAVEQR